MNIPNSILGRERKFAGGSFSPYSRHLSPVTVVENPNLLTARRIAARTDFGQFPSSFLQGDVWDQRSANSTVRRLPQLVLDLSLELHLRRRLQELRRLGRGWDGEGADPVRPDALRLAEDLLRAFSMAKGAFREPTIVPKYDGFLQIEWHDGSRSLEFELAADGWLVMGTDETVGTRQYYEAHAHTGYPEDLIPFYRWFVREEWLWPSL